MGSCHAQQEQTTLTINIGNFPDSALDRVKLLYQDRFGKNLALSQAVQHTQAEIIILTDADCRITQDWIDRLLAPILFEGEDVVTGPSLPAPSSHPFVQYQRSNDLA